MKYKHSWILSHCQKKNNDNKQNFKDPRDLYQQNQISMTVFIFQTVYIFS